MPSLHRRRLLASGAAVTGVAIAGCIGGGDDDDDGDDDREIIDPDDYSYDRDPPDDPEAAVGGEVRFAQDNARAEDFDPVIANDLYSAEVYDWVFDGMYEWTDELQLEPKIATDMPDVEEDGTRLIYEIRDDVEFSDGTPLTSEDVEHTVIAPVLEATDNQGTFSLIERTEIIDEHSIQLDLRFAETQWQMQTQAFNVVSKEHRLEDPDAYDDATPDELPEAADEDLVEELTGYVNDDYNVNPVGNTIGSGPYEFVEFTENEAAVLELRDDYWDDDVEAYVERLVLEAVEEDPTRMSAIEAGDYDVTTDIVNDDLPGLADNDDLQVHVDESPSYMYMAFNCTDEADTSDPDIRRGICHAFSMDDFVRINMNNTATAIPAPVPPIADVEFGFPMDEWSEELYPSYDPDLAEELLEENAPDDFNPTILAPAGDPREDLAEHIATRLDEIGFDATVNGVDFGTLTDMYNTGDPDDYEMYLLGWTGGPDPNAYLYSLFHEDMAGVTQGHFYEGQGDFHDKIAEARGLQDVDERRELYIDVIEEILEYLPVLPAYSMHNTLVNQTHLRDVHGHPAAGTAPRWASRGYGSIWVDN